MSAGFLELALRRPAAVLTSAVLVAAALVAAFSALPHGLPVSGFESRGSESERAQDELSASLGQEAGPGVLVLAKGDGLPRRVHEVAVETLASQLGATRDVASVVRTDAPRRERSSLLEVTFASVDPETRQDAAERIAEQLDPGPLTVLTGGEELTLLEGRDEARDEAVRFALPALLVGSLLLLVAVGWRMTLVAALSATLGALGGLGTAELADELTDVSVLGVAPALVVALALAIEGTALHAIHCRWELAAGSSPGQATRRAVAAARRPLTLATLAAAAVLAAAAILPTGYGRAIAITGGASALLTGAAVLLLAPAALAAFGWTLAAPRRRHGGRVGRAPWLDIPIGLLAALALLLPLRDARTAAFDAGGLPAASEPARAERAIGREFGPGRAAPALVAEAGGARVKRVRLDDPWGSRAAMDAVRGLRTENEAPVGGPTARALDAPARTLDELPLAGGAALAALVLLLAIGARSVRGVGLALLAPLAAGGAAGLTMLVFGEGRLADALDYASQDGINLAALVSACAALVAIGAARGGLIAGGGAGPAAGPRLPAMPAALLASAALVPAGAALLAADTLPLKEFGFALAAGALLDFVLIRLLVAPRLGARWR